MVPLRVVQWLRQTYPKPTVDPEWLDACLGWISEELHLNDINTQADDIISNVESQLLNSDLHDSMLAGTGFPQGIDTAEDTFLRGSFLVQIQAMTDIGHSAFALQNVQQMRRDRADLAGLAEDHDEEEEGPIPRYPRGMLRFDLTDGSKSLRAIEYRKMPDLELGVTPLGYKMILKDVPIRQGIAFLEPSNVVLKGYMTEELDVHRDGDFARGLRMRLGQPEPEPDAIPAGPPPSPPPPPGPGVNVGNPQRAPLREMTKDDPIPRPFPRQLPREELEPPTRRRVPVATPASSSSTVVSPYFTDTSSTSTTLASSSADLASIRLSPVRRVPHPSDALPRVPRTVEDSFDFDDDMPVDEAFLQELEAAEQAAINAVQRDRDLRQMTAVADSEVIVIDSDEDDKENLAPVSQRRVRRRIVPDDDSEVIVIE